MNNFNSEDFFSDFISDMTAANLQASGDMSIIEFANRIIFNNDESFQLYPTQKAILKSFYNEPLTDEEITILNGWGDDKRTTWVKDRNYISLVLEAGRRASKCGVRKEWLTYTDKGLYYIEEIAQENAVNLDNTGWTPLKNKMSAIQEIGKEQEITDIYVENKVKTKRITTREGYAFEATPEHKIKVLEPNGIINWKEFQYINSNDYIVINKKNNYKVDNFYQINHSNYNKSSSNIRPYINPTQVDETIGYLLGVICGDGTWKAPCIEIASHTEDAPFLIKIFKDYFGEDSTTFTPHKGKNCGSIKIGQGTLKNCLISLGFKLKDNKEKQVPWVIRRSPKSVIAGYLSGLFDTDGTVVKDGRALELCCKDYTLIREVQQLLLLFGIISNIKQHYNEKFKTFHWKLRINGLEGRRIFAKEIGFKLPRKQDKLIKDLDIKENSKEGGYLLSIPYQQDILYSFKETLKIPTDNFAVKDKNSKTMYSNFGGSIKSDKAYRSEFRDIAGNCCKKNNKENITYSKLNKLLEWAENKNILEDMINHYSYIVNNDFFFAKVESSQDKEGDVGDINVSISHKYIANGCISHNCNSESADIITTLGTITVKELHERLSNKEKVGIYTYDIESNIARSFITYDIKTESNAIEQTYLITTETGKTEIVNCEHPFLTIKKDDAYPSWVKLKDLKEKQYIATSSEIPVFGNIDKPAEQLKLWALALSNKVTNRPKLYQRYYKTLHQAFNTIEFKELDECLKKYRETITKEDIGSLSKNSTIIFLRHLLEINTRRETRQGRISSERYYKDGPDICEVTIETHKFRQDIATQFLKLGISSYFLEEPSKNIEGISICNTNSINKLIEIFGWDIYKGKEYLESCFANRNLTEGGYTTNTKSKERVDDLLENQYPLTSLNKVDRCKCRKTDIAKIAIEKNNSKLYDWATNNINWEKIVSIKPYKVEQTIAIEVENTHVIGNPIISHNSTMASIIALKEFYDLITIESPQKKYGILESSPIAILVMAQSQAQVKETIFAAMRGYAENSRFFMSLQNKGEIEILSEEIRCKKKNVAIYAKHTNSKSLVGYTVKAMILDEVARFESIGDDGKNKAFEIWDNVGAGSITFGNDSKKVAISSAWEPNDPIEVLYNIAQKNPSSLAFKLTTFQINLDIKKESKVIQSEYINDFVKARREFEGIRFSKFNTFIEIENLNRACRAVSVIDSIPSQIESITSAGTQYYAGLTIERITPNQVNDSLSFIHVDPALKKDSAALAIARPIQEDGKWKIQIDALLKWEPHTDNQGNKRVVSFIDIENKLFDICKVRKVSRITFDQWQSQSIIQKLNSQGIDAQQVSCSREMQFTYYTLFRDLLAHDYIVLPKDSIWTGNAITELSELVLKSNKQIIHPNAGKDLADAIVNAIYQCNQYMIKSGLNLTTGLNSTLVQSAGLAPLQKIKVSKVNTSNLKIGGAIDKLYKKKF